MKNKFNLILPFIMATAVAAPLAAKTTIKSVISVKGADFEFAETDVSDLAIGEAKTIVTDSGKTIDILRSQEGFEIYVDGELLDMPHVTEDAQFVHSKEIAVTCAADDGEAIECEGDTAFFADGDWDVETLHRAEGAHEIIIKSLDTECFSDEEESCEDQQVWFSDGQDYSFGDLHEEDLHFQGNGERKVIRIHGSHSSEDTDGTGEREIIVIRNAEEF